MSELPSKRQKLEHRWILKQVSDLSVPDDVKNAAANAYQELEAEDVRGASFEDLAALLQTEDTKARASVILRLRNRLRPTSQTAEPVPGLQYNMSFAFPDFCSRFPNRLID